MRGRAPGGRSPARSGSTRDPSSPRSPTTPPRRGASVGTARTRAAGRGASAVADQCRHGLARELALRDEAAGSARLDQWAEVGAVTARDEYDAGPAVVRQQAASDLEAVEVGQLHVEQDHVRVQAPCRGNRGLTVLRLAGDLPSVRLQDRPGARTEARMIVDDQDSGHTHIVAQRDFDPPYG